MGKGRGRGKVALSLGAYGATMVPGAEYSGVYDEGCRSAVQLEAWHSERIGAFGCLYGGGSGGGEKEDEKRECWDMVDFVAFETIPRLEEVVAVRAVMDKLPEGMERDYWISCVFPGERNRLPDGSTVREVVRAMLGGEARRPRGIGVNCTRVGKVEGLVREFEDAVCELGLSGEVALVLYPDGTRGEVYNTSTKEWEKIEGVEESEVSWDEMVFGNVQRARDRGVWKEIFVGGCCKTTPDHIAKLRKRIDEMDVI
ncbi:Homocysteine S-methyltransferase 2 [Lachnellula arida]|uniref:Homocysteine S-methyltransferase 2 n=1 Tax=Lachnellula arida TaxID=1316785 RepID=A0A8T9B779_9HELO|nr:Homocysteine S-methyltransferase 2 [Lachnellula arida]